MIRDTKNTMRAIFLGMAILTIWGAFGLNEASAALIVKPPTNLGLVGYWPMNEGTSTQSTTKFAGDHSGNNNTGTLTNMSLPPSSTSGWAHGKRGRALNFDGVNDWVSCTDGACGGTTKLDMGTRNWTVSSWVKGATAQGRVVSKSDFFGGTNPDGWFIGMSATGRVMAGIRKNGIADISITDDGVTFGDRNWHHILVVFNRGGTLDRYVDGVQTGTQDSISSLSGQSIDNANEFRIGARDAATDEIGRAHV